MGVCASSRDPNKGYSSEPQQEQKEDTKEEEKDESDSDSDDDELRKAEKEMLKLQPSFLRAVTREREEKEREKENQNRDSWAVDKPLLMLHPKRRKLFYLVSAGFGIEEESTSTPDIRKPTDKKETFGKKKPNDITNDWIWGRSAFQYMCHDPPLEKLDKCEVDEATLSQVMRKSLGFGINLSEVKTKKKRAKKEDKVEKGVFHMPRLDAVVKMIDAREAEFLARVEEANNESAYYTKISILLLGLFDILSYLLKALDPFVSEVEKLLNGEAEKEKHHVVVIIPESTQSPAKSLSQIDAEQIRQRDQETKRQKKMEQERTKNLGTLKRVKEDVEFFLQVGLHIILPNAKEMRPLSEFKQFTRSSRRTRLSSRGDLSPSVVSTDDGSPEEFVEEKRINNPHDVLPPPIDITTCVAKINSGKGHLARTPFSDEETQASIFEPQGLYLQNEDLSAYYRCFMWCTLMELRFEEHKEFTQANTYNAICAALIYFLLKEIRQGGREDIWQIYEKNVTKTVGPPNNLTAEGLKRLIEGSKIASFTDFFKPRVVDSFLNNLFISDEGKPSFRRSSFDPSGENISVENIRSFTLVGQRVLVDHWFSYCDCKDKHLWLDAYVEAMNIVKEKEKSLAGERGPLVLQRLKEQIRLAEENVRKIREHCLLHVKIPAVFDAVDENKSKSVDFKEFLTFFKPAPHVYGQEFCSKHSYELLSPDAKSEQSSQSMSPSSTSASAAPTFTSSESELDRLARMQREEWIRQQHIEKNSLILHQDVYERVEGVKSLKMDLVIFRVEDHVMRPPPKQSVFPDDYSSKTTFKKGAPKPFKLNFLNSKQKGSMYEFFKSETWVWFRDYMKQNSSTEFYCVMNYRLPVIKTITAPPGPKGAPKMPTKYTTFLLALCWCPDRFDFRKQLARQNLTLLTRSCGIDHSLMIETTSNKLLQSNIDTYLRGTKLK